MKDYSRKTYPRKVRYRTAKPFRSNQCVVIQKIKSQANNRLGR